MNGLVAVHNLEVEIDRLDAETEPPLTEADRERLMALGQDLVQAWASPSATSEIRKKIIRAVISEIIVDILGETLALIIHWQGGDHTRLTVKKNRAGQTRWTTDDDVVDLVRALDRQIPDETIASVLNRSGKSTGYGNSWTRGRICSLRHQYHIPIYREGERTERGEVTLNEAAAALALSTTTIRRLIAEGELPARQHCKGAPWIIRLADLERNQIRRQADARRSRRPPPDERQQNLLNLSIT
jgi:excisionase family DNA binding protein